MVINPSKHHLIRNPLNQKGTRMRNAFFRYMRFIALTLVSCALPILSAQQSNIASSKLSSVDGVWLGTLTASAASLRVQINVKSDATGHESCTLDSLDQRAMGLECANIQFATPNFLFDVLAVKGHWEGKLSEDGKSLNGNWSQGSALVLNFTRQQAAITVPPIAYDSVIARVSAGEMQAVLDKDLAGALKSGQLAPATGGGVTIGVVQHGVRRVFSYGAVKPNSIFEIGSITKTFTGVSLDDPVRTLLPQGTVAKPDGAEITLVDLATQHSGLPRMPSNFNPKDVKNPYADFTPADLYAFLAKQGVGKPAKTEFLYSNLGFGLLGQALAVHASLSYEALLKQQVISPLGLHDTTISLSAEQQARFAQGHGANHQPANAWDLGSLEGAGAIRSTADDVLTYLEANLHPDTVKVAPQTGPTSTLGAALNLQHELRGRR